MHSPRELAAIATGGLFAASASWAAWKALRGVRHAKGAKGKRPMAGWAVLTLATLVGAVVVYHGPPGIQEAVTGVYSPRNHPIARPWDALSGGAHWWVVPAILLTLVVVLAPATVALVRRRARARFAHLLVPFEESDAFVPFEGWRASDTVADEARQPPSPAGCLSAGPAAIAALEDLRQFISTLTNLPEPRAPSRLCTTLLISPTPDAQGFLGSKNRWARTVVAANVAIGLAFALWVGWTISHETPGGPLVYKLALGALVGTWVPWLGFAATDTRGLRAMVPMRRSPPSPAVFPVPSGPMLPLRLSEEAAMRILAGANCSLCDGRGRTTRSVRVPPSTVSREETYTTYSPSTGSPEDPTRGLITRTRTVTETVPGGWGSSTQTCSACSGSGRQFGSAQDAVAYWKEHLRAELEEDVEVFNKNVEAICNVIHTANALARWRAEMWNRWVVLVARFHGGRVFEPFADTPEFAGESDGPWVRGGPRLPGGTELALLQPGSH